MIPSVVEYIICAEGELRRLVRVHLSGGVVVVPCKRTLELYDALTVRLTVGGRSLDLDAVVAVPRLEEHGRPCVGVHLKIDRSQWAGLEWLLNVLALDTVRHHARGEGELPNRVGTGEFIAIDDSGEAAVLTRFSGSYPAVMDATEPSPSNGGRRRRLLVQTPHETWSLADTQPIDPSPVGRQTAGESAGGDAATAALRALVRDRPAEARNVLMTALQHAPGDPALLACWRLLHEGALAPEP